MSEVTRFDIGANARCRDGLCGVVIGMIVETAGWRLSHLVVEPQHRSGLAKLVPVDLLQAGPEVALSCSMTDFDKLIPAEETSFLPANTGGYGGYGPGQMVILPRLTLGDGNIAGSAVKDLGNAFQPVVSELIPEGEAEVRGRESVTATDGEIGEIRGVVVDSATYHLTQIVLQEGHIWSRKQVTIPISAVASIGQELQLNMTVEEVQKLPAVDSGPPSGSR